MNNYNQREIYFINERTCSEAALDGRLEVLKFARELGCQWDDLTCTWAAGEGHLHVLKWAREHGCPWDELTCEEAAQGGHLEVLQWAREHGCPWDVWTCISAAQGGHLEVLQWAREHGCPWDENMYEIVVECRLREQREHAGEHLVRWWRVLKTEWAFRPGGNGYLATKRRWEETCRTQETGKRHKHT